MTQLPEERKNRYLDKSIDFLFSDDPRKWLLFIVILGFALRFIVASNLSPVADESLHTVHSIGFSKLAPLSTLAQAPIWYYLTDYSFRIFGISLLTGRFLSVIFGTLSIIFIYLIVEYISNKKAALISAFLLAISAFHITWTSSYQDQTLMFFVLGAIYFFIKTYKETKKISLTASVFLGIAALVKIIAGVFCVVFTVFIIGILYKNFKRDKKLFKNNLKRAILFVLIIFISLSPIVSYNYFLYKEKGIVDLPLAQFLRINPEFYMGPGLHHDEGFVLGKLGKNLYSVLTVYFIKEDILIFLVGLCGLIYSFSKLRNKDKRFEFSFLLIIFFFSLVFTASSIVLQTHYTEFFPMFAIFGGVLLGTVYNLPQKKNYKKILIFLLVLILIFNVYHLRGPLTSKSALGKMRSFSSSIDDSTLVIMDARIYRAMLIFMVNDKKYIESSYLPQIIQASTSAGSQVPVRTLFIECVTDDCGWGTIQDQPDFNRSVEEMIDYFRNNSQKTTELTGGGSIEGVRGTETVGEPYFRIYETYLYLNPQIFNILDQTHNHFFYHIPRDEYPEQAFDYYHVKGFGNNLLNIFSYTVLYILLLLAALSIFVPFYLLFLQSFKKNQVQDIIEIKCQELEHAPDFSPRVLEHAQDLFFS